MQRGTVGKVELEPTEDLALHSQQLVLGVGVVHQGAESRHLEEQARKIKNKISLWQTSFLQDILVLKVYN